MLGVAAACLLALVGRLCYIHAAMAGPGSRIALQLEQQQQATMPLPARRGEILDVEGRVLAGSQERPSIFADPSLLEDPEPVAEALGAILNIRRDELRRLLTERNADGTLKRFVWLKRRVEGPEAEAARAWIEKHKILGVGILNEPFRRYPMGSLGAHVVGFVNIDGEGMEGVERRYDSILRGTSGSITVCRDAARRPIWPAPGQDALIPPRDGMTVKLTLDAAVQEILEAQVSAAVTHFKAESGVGIVMNPRTGDVLGMASVPTYDPNRPGDSPPSARRNRCLTDPTEPGSTFKPFIASAALAEKVVKPGESIYCHSGLYVVGSRNLHDHHPYGDLTFEQIVIKSSNIGMAILGQRLGNERMHRYLSAPYGFGFGSRTGIELDGEDPGMLLPLRRWTTFSTTSVPMGQEVAVTPLQLATAFCAIVNGGRAVVPRVVRAIIDPRGEVVEDFSGAQNGRQVIPPDVAEYMTKTVLVGVVNEGTGLRARLPNYQVLGKTGTAQIARPGGGGYQPDAYTSSFVAAAPASDPQVVVLIMVRRPQRSIAYYGGTVAAPAVREVLARTLAYLEIPPDKSPENEPKSAWLRPTRATD